MVDPEPPVVALRILAEQNPWQATGRVPATLAPRVERSMAEVLRQGLGHQRLRRFQLVLGPRRVGKTTAMYQAVAGLLRGGIAPERIWWLRLDHPVLMRVPLGDLVRTAVERARATTAAPAIILLDELVYAGDWDLWLKTFYDEAWPVAIAGTSSATAALRQRRLPGSSGARDGARVLESGVGRWTERYLAPYLLPEYLELLGEGRAVETATSLAGSLRAAVDAPPSLSGVARRRAELLLVGGFPEMLAAQSPDWDDQTRLLESQRTLRSDAVERAIYKDIPQSFGVDNPLALERLLYVLADQTAGLLSPSRISGQLDMAQPTVERYLSYLERAFLVFTLLNYSGSESGRQRRGRKLHFVDVAVRNAALQRGIAPLDDQVEMGQLLETQAAAHLHSLATRNGVRLFHWRDGKDEVDLVYDDHDEPLAFEIASSVSHSRRGLHALAGRTPRFAGGCWLVAPNAQAVAPNRSEDGIGTLPLELFLLVVGAQAEAALLAA